MKNKYTYLIKNIGILTISNFASKILVFLLVPLYTSVLSTEEYGTYDLAVTTIQLLFPILTLNIADGVMRYLMEKDSNTSSVISIGIKYVGIGIVLGVICILQIHYIVFFKSFRGLELYIFLYYLSYILNQFLNQVAKGLEKVTDMGIAGVVSTVVLLVTNVLLLLVFKCGLRGFFLANILGQLTPVSYLVIRLKIWRYFTLNNNKELSTNMLVYSTPLIFTTLGWWVNSASDKYVVAFLVGVAANGLLSVSYKIPSIINTIQSIFIQAWQISAIKEYDLDERKRFYSSMFDYLNALMVLLCSVLIMLTKPLAHILYANDFYQAWKYVPFLLVSSVINAASGFVGPILSAQKNSKAMAMSAIYGAVANVVLNFLLVYIWGPQGATIATMISSYIIYFVRKKAASKDFQVTNQIKVAIVWILIILQAVIEIYIGLWQHEVVILIVLAWLYKDIVLNIIKKIREKRG